MIVWGFCATTLLVVGVVVAPFYVPPTWGLAVPQSASA